jgi:hypothetical protein
MRKLGKGEAKPGMTIYHPATGSPYHVLNVSNRGSYDVLQVSKKSKSGKINKKWSTAGNEDFVI